MVKCINYEPQGSHLYEYQYHKSHRRLCAEIVRAARMAVPFRMCRIMRHVSLRLYMTKAQLELNATLLDTDLKLLKTSQASAL